MGWPPISVVVDVIAFMLNFSQYSGFFLYTIANLHWLPYRNCALGASYFQRTPSMSSLRILVSGSKASVPLYNPLQQWLDPPTLKDLFLLGFWSTLLHSIFVESTVLPPQPVCCPNVLISIRIGHWHHGHIQLLCKGICHDVVNE